MRIRSLAGLANAPTGSEIRKRYQNQCALPRSQRAAIQPLAYEISTYLNRWVQERTARRTVFGSDLGCGPYWAIICDLALSRINNQKVSVTDACIASGVPTTTALRCIGLLETKGHIVRQRDRYDGRRFFVSLTDSTVLKVEELIVLLQDRSSCRREVED